MGQSILVVDSSPAVRRMIEDTSLPEGFEVTSLQDGPTALEAARRNTPALIIADYHLENMTFSGFCKELNKLDHLRDTYVISLVDAADKPDETHLRTLGVKAFLKKPIQPDRLLALLALAQQNHQASATPPRLKRRTWPPDSTSTDLPEEDAVSEDMQEPHERLEEQSLVLEEAQTTMTPSTPASTTASTSMPSPAPEDAMAGLFHHLLGSMTAKTEQRLAEILPEAIEREAATRIRAAVKQELDGQLGAILSQEQLGTIIQPLLEQQLPGLVAQALAAQDTTIRQTISELVGPAITQALQDSLQDHLDTGIKKHLPPLLEHHVKALDEVVKEEIRQAALQQAPLIADDVVRTTAEQVVEQAVQRVVPELAEQQIKAELSRLTAAA